MKPSEPMSRDVQGKLLRLMLLGHRLAWYGDHGPELAGHGLWPKKRTVRAMLERGLLVWAPWRNGTHRELGICELMRPCRECGGPTDASDRLCLACWGKAP